MKNEQGYTLVTVLLTITVFMVVFLSFVGQSFSSVKQNQVVEKQSKSVTIAEMGISYYQIMVQNLYTSYKPTATNTVKTTIEQDRTAKTLKTSTEYSNQAAALMKEYIKQELNKEINAKPIEGKPNSSFKIVEKNYFTSTDNKILLKIMGSDQGKNTTLSTEMTLGILPTINGLTSSGGTNTNTLPTFNTIPKPVISNPECKDSSTIKSTCTQYLMEVPNTISENFNGLAGKTIYAIDV
ncbi:hypothetical protein V7111_27275, partial [Neobacillus niacini]|uniref:hypothetical protein n=1 Tax=Neobacillus niacini TaxID=86668 RepID=UPI0030030C80